MEAKGILHLLNVFSDISESAIKAITIISRIPHALAHGTLTFFQEKISFILSEFIS